MTSVEDFQFWEDKEVKRKPNLENSVDVPTIHSADPLIFALPKHFYGRLHCPDERYFSLANRIFLTNFFT
jgi:hypothetical protein